eukprot:gene30710-35738_t
MSAVPDEGQEVLDCIMAAGHFDEIRKEVTEQLRQNEDLKEFTMTLLEDSTTLAENADYKPERKKKVLEELRKELEEKLLDRASKAAWATMDPNSPVGKTIEQKVCEALTEIYKKRSQEQSQAPTGGYAAGQSSGPAQQQYNSAPHGFSVAQSYNQQPYGR